MSILVAILEGIEAATALVSATKRLERAARATEPPKAPKPPPPLGSGYPEAMAYIRGRDDEAARREEHERLGRAFEDFARKAASADEAEAEKPTEGS
jgi:hypothetical protein